jgi:phospholipid/cholesterol/gamma-HCH transport system substrate-binding protein
LSASELLAFLVALVIGASHLNIGARSYTASLANTGGLRVSEPVQVAGVNVGKVTGIKLGGDKVEGLVHRRLQRDTGSARRPGSRSRWPRCSAPTTSSVIPGGAGDIGDSVDPGRRTRASRSTCRTSSRRARRRSTSTT